jgi:translation initiation factor 2 beta subunit (eIF-2beta)/eIF-5
MDPTQRHDPAYRYMMEPLEVAVHRHSTLLPNLPAVARDIKTPVMYLQVFLAKQRNTRALKSTWGLKGEHDPAALQALVLDYVALLVMCPRCRKPDTRLLVERSTVILACLGCGTHTTIRAATNPAHKAILKHPPSKSEHHGLTATDAPAVDVDDHSGINNNDDDDDDDDDDDTHLHEFSLGTSTAEVAQRALDALGAAGAARLSDRATRLALFRQRVEANVPDLQAEAARCDCEAQAVHVIVQCRVAELCNNDAPAELLRRLFDAAPLLRQVGKKERRARIPAC